MKAGIIGGGMIGAGWAELLRTCGHEARVYDQQPELCQGAASIAEAVSGAELVLEAVAEREAVKRTVLAAVEAVAPAAALIGSASSSLLPSRLQAGMLHPERVLVIHPLHPVMLIPVVEVVPGAATAPWAVERARSLLLDLGKRPVVLSREVPGYVVNRLAAAVWREALHLAGEGVVGVAELDEAASLGPCLGWAVQGPFQTYHLAAREGLEAFMRHLAPAFAAIWQDLARWERLDPTVVARLAAATGDAYADSSRAQQEARRDATLRAVLAALHMQAQQD